MARLSTMSAAKRTVATTASGGSPPQPRPGAPPSARAYPDPRRPAPEAPGDTANEQHGGEDRDARADDRLGVEDESRVGPAHQVVHPPAEPLEQSRKDRREIDGGCARREQ